MRALPPVDPPAWWRAQTRIGRDHYIRVDTNDYSVRVAIRRTVTVLIGEGMRTLEEVGRAICEASTVPVVGWSSSWMRADAGFGRSSVLPPG
ncbi:Mu transposase domain-containing protein [Streptomyces cinereospinus]|uniref:Transposase for insertion sequence element IS21-like C-terminal domain-containing protein n=1 Tax=Streptomyces cinereospinus TaxID=285561 RepID=A0ABV5N3S7_9ACTN